MATAAIFYVEPNPVGVQSRPKINTKMLSPDKMEAVLDMHRIRVLGAWGIFQPSHQ